jgi:putative adenylate-forming enzyme
VSNAAVGSDREQLVHHVRALTGRLCARDTWSREQLVAHQQTQLQALLAHAASASPYYRDILPRHTGARLDELPTLPKSTLVAEFDRIVTDPRLRKTALEEHMDGPRVAQPFLGTYRAFSTSGTTGLRGMFVFTEDEMATWVAVCLRGLARLGVGPTTRFVAIGAPSSLHITNQLFAAFQNPGVGAPRLSVATPMDEIVTALNDYQPEVILTYASFAGMLAHEQLQGRLRMSPRRIVTTSEPLTEPVTQQIEDAWQVGVGNGYAATEAPLMASSAAEHSDLLVNEDVVVLEIVDDENRPVPPGALGSKVLLTNLVNRVLPLIRYELSDTVTPAGDEPRLPYPYKRLARVDGRSVDVLYLPRAGGGEVAVHPFRLGTRFARFHDVRQFQIVHDERGLTVRVVARTGAASNVAEHVRDEVTAELVAAGAASPTVAVELVDALEREPGPAAKLKLVHSSLPRRAG